MATETTDLREEFGTIRVQHYGEMPACPVHALAEGDRVMWAGGEVDVIAAIDPTASGRSYDMTLRSERSGAESHRRMRASTLVALANVEELRTRSESVPTPPEAREEAPEPAPGTDAPTDSPSAPEAAPAASEGAPRRRRSRDVALVVSDGAREHTITSRQRRFLLDLAATPQFAEGASALWLDVLIDELQVAGSEFDNGMRVGAMVSTLREKGMVSAWSEGREDPSTGRERRVKAMWFTGLGAGVMRALGREVALPVAAEG